MQNNMVASQFLVANPVKKEPYCRLCKHKIEYVDYRMPDYLARFLNRQGKMLPRRITTLCARHQRRVIQAVKRARILALLPYVTDNFK